MKTPKENEKLIDDFLDYLPRCLLGNVPTDPFIPTSEAELESYNDVYQYRPSVIPSKNGSTEKKAAPYK